MWICGLLYILFSTQLRFPCRHFQYTEVLLLLWNGYLSGWGCFICRRGWKVVGGCGEFFYWWQNSISSEWLFYTTTLLLLDDMVDTLKNHIHFNHRNWQVAYSPFSPGLRVELRGEISSTMQGFCSCRVNDTDVFNSKYWMRETDDRNSYEKTALFQAVKLH